MKKDLSSDLKIIPAIAPAAAVTNDTAFVSEIVDLANFGSCVFAGVLGTNADANATLTVLVEHGDDPALGDNTAVPDVHLVGVEAMGLDFADDDSAFKIGYIGPKRYVRVTVTPGGNTGNQFLGAVWILGHPRKKPQSTQVNA